MARCEEAEDQTDRERLGAAALYRIEHRLDFRVVEPFDHRAVGGHTLPHLEPQALGHQRILPLWVERVEVGACLAADRERVPEPARGDQGRPRPAAGEQRVGRDGRAVDHFLRIELMLGQPIDHRRGRIRRGRQALRHPQRGAVPVEEIGESAADIDTQEPAPAASGRPERCAQERVSLSLVRGVDSAPRAGFVFQIMARLAGSGDDMGVRR